MDLSPSLTVAASVAVMRDGVLEHAAAFGRRSGEEPVAPDHRFRVASISKTITAIAVLQLVEAGVVALDEPVGGRVAARLGVGQPTARVADLTVRHLLTHRSGFGQYENLFFAEQVDSCDAAATVGVTGPIGEPGTGFRYSNLNFCLLGIVVEVLTGRPYHEVVEEQLLAPLGITGMRLAGTFDGGTARHEVRTLDGGFVDVRQRRLFALIRT